MSGKATGRIDRKAEKVYDKAQITYLVRAFPYVSPKAKDRLTPLYPSVRGWSERG